VVHPVLAGSQYLVKEHVGLFKAANNYDIYDPATGQIVLECREPNLGFFTKWLRFTEYKRYTPFDIELRTPGQELVLRVQRGWTFLRSRVSVSDARGKALGGFRQKLLSIGGAFEVLDEQDRPVCMLEGKWTSWEFAFKAAGQELAHVTKKWSGIGRELFTSADNYMLEIAAAVPKDSAVRSLIMASVLCIDMVLKER
jgi:uncharacterized protein YxjI